MLGVASSMVGRIRMSRLNLTVLCVVSVIMAITTIGCYDSATGHTEIGGAINFKLPAFPETGSNAVQIFTEMHYQPSYRIQEVPRLYPPVDSVPTSGKEIRYTSLDEYKNLEIPGKPAQSYNQLEAQALYAINCQVCHGPTLKGDGTILNMWPKTQDGNLKGPVPADLTSEITRTSTNGELFAYITLGGRQGAAARLRNKPSNSPMPEFGHLLTENDRWTLVQFLRGQIAE